MSALLRDLRFGGRLLARSPVFALTAGLLLAAGICANTLIFSVINALLLKPLPVSHPENLVRLVELHPNDFVTWNIPYDFCAAAASRDTDFSEVICQGEADVAFSSAGSTERVRVHLVSPNFFSSLGVRPYLGRLLTAEDERTAAPNAVLSYGFWQRKLGGEPSVLGRGIVLAGHPFTIVGVSPEAFNGLTIDTSPDIRVPAATDRSLVQPFAEMNPLARPLFAEVFGRLRNGVAFNRANAEVDALLHDAYEDAVGQIFPPAKGASRADAVIKTHLRLESIVNGVSTLRPQFSRSLDVLMAGVALLLLMACANIAGLLLARSAGRDREMGIRLALGASPARIVRQLLTEGLMLSLLGGAAGILLTFACLPWVGRNLPPIRDRAAVLEPLAVHIGIDFRVLAFAVGATVLTAILFALAPALRSARRRIRFQPTRPRLQPVISIAICTLILMGAALLAATLQRMRSMNPGFDRDRIITFTIDPSLKRYTPDQVRVLSKQVLAAATALPGVSGAAMASRALMRGTGQKATFGVAGSRMGPADFLNSSLNEVTPGYFETMGMSLLAGRAFNWFDRNADGPRKTIVNRTFAAKFFPGINPIGRRFGFPGPGGTAVAGNEIVGVVSDAKYRSLREPVPPTVFAPVVDGFDYDFILHLRTRERPEALIAPVRAMLRSLDAELPIVEVHTLREEVEASLWQERLLAVLSTAFAVIAALLASIGLYGALDYAVKSRTREIGVRMALGAPPAQIVGLFSREALLLTGGGLVLGLCGYAAATVWIRRVLYELRPWEPLAVLCVVSLVVLMAAIATLPAALRAARVDPSSALRW